MEPFASIEYQWKAQITGRVVDLVNDMEVVVKRWNGNEVASKNTTLSLPGISPPIARMVIALFLAEELPRTFEFSLAWVRPTHNSGDHELRVYSATSTPTDHVIQHGWLERIDLRKDSSIAQELAQINQKTHLSDPVKLAPFERAGIATHDVDVVRYDRSKTALIGVKDRMKVYRYPLGEYCRALPIPPFFNKKQAHPADAITLSTFDVRQRRFALNESAWARIEVLNHLVGDRSQIILIHGSPGSGKELYAKAIHRLSVRTLPNVFRKLSVAGMELEEFRETLAGVTTGGGKYAPGEIEKARGGTLMLDELDKACGAREGARALYGWLLRVLEAREYQPVGGAEQMKYEDVAWLLTGAFKEGDGIPGDFWSRLSGRFETPDLEATESGIVAYFLDWWFRWVVDRTGVRACDTLNVHDDSAGLMASLAQVLALGDCERNLPTLEPADQVVNLATCFATWVIERTAATSGGGGEAETDSLISGRTIRQSVRAAVERMIWEAKGSGIKSIWDQKQGTVERALDAAQHVAEMSMKMVSTE